MSLRTCLREPIPEIEEAARNLDEAVSAHLRGAFDTARELFKLADNKTVWHWTDSVWGKKSPYLQACVVAGAPPTLPVAERSQPAKPTPATRLLVHQRDGYYCRFCTIPVIRPEIRDLIRRAYPAEVPWCRKNECQHAAFQCMWAQYDHIVPHSRGGTSDIDNVYLTCAACNFGRMERTLEEVGLAHPASRAPRRGAWDGLERFRPLGDAPPVAAVRCPPSSCRLSAPSANPSHI